jgi:hypothetical protein
MKVAFLGSIAGKDMLAPDALEALSDSDIVFVSVADADAHAFATLLATKAIIPIGYTDMKDEALQEFLKESGAAKNEVLEKLTIKRKDIESLKSHVFILKI